jgi:hypothetical protein
MNKFLFLFMLIPSICFANLDGKEKYDEHEPIVLNCLPKLAENETATYVWNTPAPLRIINVKENRIHVWSPPGSHVISVTVVTVDWQTRSVSVKEYSRPFVVAGQAPRPPPVVVPVVVVDPDKPVDPLTPLPVDKPDLVAVIYESDDFIPPPYITGALRQLREQGLEVRSFDKDVASGSGNVPKQIASALSAARRIRLPALVLVRDGKVTRAIRLPRSTSAILEAVNGKN